MLSAYSAIVIGLAVIGSLLTIAYVGKSEIQAQTGVSYRDLLADAADSATADSSIDDMDWQDLLATTGNKDAASRIDAALKLGEVVAAEPSIADDVVPGLLKLLSPGADELVRAAAEISLRQIGDRATPFVKQMLESGILLERATGCAAVKCMGPSMVSLLPELEELLTDGAPGSQRAALFALQGLGMEGMPLLDEIVECLRSDDFNVQCMACRVLEPFGPDAMPAESLLLGILETGNPSSRSWAAVVLGAIGPTSDNDIVPLLIRHLRESRAQTEKQRILLGLAHLGREAARAENDVREYLDKPAHYVQPYAAYALWSINGEFETLGEVLRVALSNVDFERDAFDIIGRLDQEALPMLATITAKLASPDEDIRELAIAAIGKMGPSAAAAIPEVTKLLGDPDALVRHAARVCIAALEARPDAAE